MDKKQLYARINEYLIEANAKLEIARDTNNQRSMDWWLSQKQAYLQILVDMR